MMEYIQDIKRPAELRGCVFSWMAEYSETNHIRMSRVVELLNKYEDKEDFRLSDILKEERDEIFKIGCQIGKEGGLTAQIACFYISTNFMKNDNPVLIKYLWNNAGEWQN
jgi:hypothetical protein